eukprot:CAMPEP_0172182060 /NCGR_PEP_ID=MMETSP1050-20130122/18181_1 /TAXON_ID=233186 /ORGANISM="Cryptomonas curvata, Strain CCAP979/52" /LENGTH=248 /DNA_ID=CAMNT_0012855447 /DNA_START=6 /DNA_END=748 /DNA_ORIENTATION=-
MSGQVKDANKIFIGGISWETTEQDLRDHFEPYGTLTDCVVMREKVSGKARGFGFVTFAESSAADSVLAAKHDILGRTVEVKAAVPRGEGEAPSGRSGGPMMGGDREDPSQRVMKIFVGGLSPEVTDASFREYFSKFGTITDSTVMVDKDTNRSRGFGFVTFDSWQVVDQIIRRTDHSLSGKVVEIKKAFPKGSGPGDMRDRGGPMGRGGPMSGGRFGGGGPPSYGGGGGGGYGGGGYGGGPRGGYGGG